MTCELEWFDSHCTHSSVILQGSSSWEQGRAESWKQELFLSAARMNQNSWGAAPHFPQSSASSSWPCQPLPTFSLSAPAAVSNLGENTLPWTFHRVIWSRVPLEALELLPSCTETTQPQSRLLTLSPKLGGQIQALFETVPVLAPEPCPSIIWETTSWS